MTATAARATAARATAATATAAAVIVAATAALLAIVAVVSGCNDPQQPLSETTEPLPIDRLVAAHAEDLESKKFQVIADFEEPRQASLFSRVPDGGSAGVEITTARARPETGVGSLRMSLTNSLQQVVAADSPEAEWALPQDWTAYNLLLMSVFSPREQGGFRFSIGSGSSNPLVYEHPRIMLEAGWNAVRIDLLEVSEQVYLGDVREMRFWCDPLDSPIDLYLDDIILADNTRELMPNPDNTPGQLSLESAGRRLIVTAANRFVLVLYHGQIRQWFDLASDPQRLHNLAGGNALGPIPTLGGFRDGTILLEPDQWSMLGPLVESFQRVVEASPVRVVIHGEWRFARPDSPADESSPYHRWVFSIYRNGEVYVECSGYVPGMNLQEVGMAFGCDAAAGFVPHTVAPAPAATGDETASYTLFSQPPRAGSADLLVVPAVPAAGRPMVDPAGARVNVVYRAPVQSDQFLFNAMLRVWPSDIDNATQAGPMARAYQQPLPVAVDTGSLLRTDAGDFDGDGYSEARGYYVLKLDGRIAKLRLDGRHHLRFSPAFKLVDVIDRDVWVYVDGRQIKNLQRDQNGNILFEVPGVISREILIEITSSKRGEE